MAARDLCVAADVYGYVPGYDSLAAGNAPTNAKIADLISAESRSMHQEGGREFVAITAGSSTRTFDLTGGICSRRELPIGDASTVTAVELFDYDGTTSLGVITASLYVLKPRVREEWQPIRRLSFPYRPAGAQVRLAPGRTLTVTGAWGFPAIPKDIVQACAKRVIVRYLSDVAGAGTEFSDAIAADLNIGGLLRSSKVALDGYKAGPFA